jgi:uncharacterized membrane protein
MVTSPIGILLFVAAVYLVFKSPKRTETLTRMVVAFIATVLVICVPAFLLRRGDPEAWGRIAGLVGLLVAVIVGQWHSRSPRTSP